MYATALDKAIAHHFIDNGGNWDEVASSLGITSRSLRMKRNGATPFTSRETHVLATYLGVSMDEVYAMLPDQST